MKHIIVALALASAAAGLAQAADLKPRPMPEMQGNCDNYAWNLSAEFRLWGLSPVAVAAVPAISAGVPEIVAGSRLEVALRPQEEMVFAAPPEQDRRGPGRYAGLVSFRVPEDGLYRVSAGNGLWIDIVHGSERLPSAGFEMQTKCATIFKSVAWRLQAGDIVGIQLNGSPTPSVGLLVSRAD